MNYVDAINAFETVWWTTLGVAFGFAVWRDREKSSPRLKRLGTVTAVLLILFGISDAIELYTKAWWRPWWLLVLKGVCITGLVACAFLWNRRPAS